MMGCPIWLPSIALATARMSYSANLMKFACILVVEFSHFLSCSTITKTLIRASYLLLKSLQSFSLKGTVSGTIRPLSRSRVQLWPALRRHLVLQEAEVLTGPQWPLTTWSHCSHVRAAPPSSTATWSTGGGGGRRCVPRGARGLYSSVDPFPQENG